MDQRTYEVIPGIEGTYGPRIVIKQKDRSKTLDDFLSTVSMWGGYDNEDFEAHTVSWEIPQVVYEAVKTILFHRFDMSVEDF